MGAILKKLTLLVFLCVTFIGSIMSGFYLLVNLSEIPDKITEVDIKSSQPTVEIGEEKIDESSLPTFSPETKEERIDDVLKRLLSGLPTYELFKSISIDLSAVTPFLLFWLFLALFVNAVKYLMGSLTVDALKERRDTLPVFVWYESTAIQLGFIGTLWGFLLIGYRMQGISAGQSVDALDIILKAFGTALLSTFTAVVIVYVFIPIFRGIWRWMLNVGKDDDDIGIVLYQLTEKLQKTSDAVEKLQKGVNSLEEKIAQVSPNRIIKLLEDIAHDAKVTSEINDDLRRNHLNGLSGKVSSVESKVEEIDKSSKKSMEQAKHAEDSIVKKLEGIQKTLAQLSKELTKQAEQTEKSIIGKLRYGIGRLVIRFSKKSTDQIERTGKSVVEKLNGIEKTLAQFSKKSQLERTDVVEKLDGIEKTLAQFSENSIAQAKQTENAIVWKLNNINKMLTRYSKVSTKSANLIQPVVQSENGRNLFSELWDKIINRLKR